MVLCRSGLCKIHIPEGVELCDECFRECRRLSRVTFGESSYLKLVGKGEFSSSVVREIRIIDGVEELCEECSSCKGLSRVTFGDSSSLKLIWKRAFCESALSCFLFTWKREFHWRVFICLGPLAPLVGRRFANVR